VSTVRQLSTSCSATSGKFLLRIFLARSAAKARAGGWQQTPAGVPAQERGGVERSSSEHRGAAATDLAECSSGRVPDCGQLLCGIVEVTPESLGQMLAEADGEVVTVTIDQQPIPHDLAVGRCADRAREINSLYPGPAGHRLRLEVTGEST